MLKKKKDENLFSQRFHHHSLAKDISMTSFLYGTQTDREEINKFIELSNNNPPTKKFD